MNSFNSHDLESLYLNHAGDVPVDLWRAFVTCAYFTGLRSMDLLGLNWSNFDFDSSTVRLTIRKTGYRAELPLHPVAVAHLQRLERTGEAVFHFPGVRPAIYGLRRLSFSAIQSVAKGAGGALLCHAIVDVSPEALRSSVAAMPFPPAWNGGAA